MPLLSVLPFAAVGKGKTKKRSDDASQPVPEAARTAPAVPQPPVEALDLDSLRKKPVTLGVVLAVVTACGGLLSGGLYFVYSEVHDGQKRWVEHMEKFGKLEQQVTSIQSDVSAARSDLAQLRGAQPASAVVPAMSPPASSVSLKK